MNGNDLTCCAILFNFWDAISSVTSIIALEPLTTPLIDTHYGDAGNSTRSITACGAVWQLCPLSRCLVTVSVGLLKGLLATLPLLSDVRDESGLNCFAI